MEACSASAESGDGRPVFSLTPGGQLKMPRLGNYCVTMAGESAASSDIAQGADLTATSSNGQHSVKNIADGDAQSYWASASDPAAPVDVQLDFGEAKHVKSIEIEWENPAQARQRRVLSAARSLFAPCRSGIRATSGQRRPVDQHLQHRRK